MMTRTLKKEMQRAMVVETTKMMKAPQKWRKRDRNLLGIAKIETYNDVEVKFV